MMHVTAVGNIPRIERPESETLAAVETARFVDVLRSLDDAGWSKPTDCPGWDVRAIAGHVLGMVETFSSLTRLGRDLWAGSRAAGDRPFIDGLTSVQVRDHAPLAREQLVERLATTGPRQARWRASRRLLRQLPIKNALPDGTSETWKAGYLVDIILTRDTWMHRVDVTRATGREMVLTRDHDGRIVADVVAEWGRRHGRPFTLHLEGPAGGTYAQGRGGEELTVDTLEFCRILSGRSPAAAVGLLAQPVPF